MAGGKSGAQVRVQVRDEGACVAIGNQADWQVLLGQDPSGVFKLAYTKGDNGESEAPLYLRCDPRNEAAEMRLCSRDNSAIILRANGKDATFEVARDDHTERGRSSVKIGQEALGSYLRMGTKFSWVALQSAREGATLLQLANDGKPLVRLQATEKGMGLGIDRPDGKPAIRLGLSPTGAISDDRWDEDGRPIRNPRNEAASVGESETAPREEKAPPK